MTYDYDPAVRAISHLLSVRDALEFAARAPGARVSIDRDELEYALDSLGIAAKMVLDLVGPRRD
jgi:hypothetical protein